MKPQIATNNQMTHYQAQRLMNPDLRHATA